MHKPTLPAAAVLLATALTACGSSGGDAAPSVTPTPSTPAISADACRAYDNAIAMFYQGIDGTDHTPFVIAQFGPLAAERIRTAAPLATGQGRAVMEASATRIQVLADAGGGVDDGPEVKAVKDSIAAVDKLCREAGASLSHVPAPG
ncbi:MAG: hypothetical protein ACRDXB_02290 [Actinomycetes bacterium]